MAINKNELPLSLSPQHIKEILEMGRRQTYEFLNDNPPFPVHRIGGRGEFKIPRDPFFRWFEGEEQK
ncbi:hypothetical protein J41TS12_18540 [Paenibacillus antibioticophila]|uniref:Uncharacterized protein n=1 Tax=Paenibacillus antibioticophila TaxID=1274374 RepID=A0A919XV48_9BACL|nr:DNA-binding protein [Paenibacillus antibioticophila]GIO36993.1 hypothetical protein J41TS12_18540 [Paenibacillus antibioticophila]